jgi:Uncharacterized conserved protein
MKKVALPSSGNMVDGHFGHCEHFTVYTIDSNNNIAQKEVVPSPNGCGCKSNIASVLAEKGVDTMLAGNIGQGAVNTLQKSGITVHAGYSGNVETVLNQFLDGDQKGSEANCNHTHEGTHDHHHENGHACSHN